MKNDILALIPARGGSKGVPGKNIKLLGGYPLIAYSICAAKMTKNIDRVIVSTDSKDIANISRKYGAEVPFMRPAEISCDNSTDLELFQHLIGWLEKNKAIPDLIIHLRPTTPFRQALEITRAIKSIKDRPDATSLRSIHELSEPPYKMFQLNADGYLEGFFPNDPRPEYYNLPRQVFPKAYHPNGYVDIIKTDFVKRSGALHGPKMLGFVTPEVAEVDRPEDFEYLEYELKNIKNEVYEYLIKNFPIEG
jgi:CMP-N-acetylneuraminic acid synthetase